MKKKSYSGLKLAISFCIALFLWGSVTTPAVANTWQTLTGPPLGPADKNGHRIEAMGGYVYMWVAWGGVNGTLEGDLAVHTDFYRYDPDGNSWSSLTNAPYPTSEPYGLDIVSAKDISGNPAIYIIGSTYDPDTQGFYCWTESSGWSSILNTSIPWNASASQDEPRNGSTLVWDGSDIIYYFPGSSYAFSQKDWYKYTISTDAWSEMGSWSLPVIQGPGNAGVVATVGSDDYIFVYLGEITSPYTDAKFYKYGPLGGVEEWTALTGHSYGADDGSDLVWDGGDYIYHSPGAYAETAYGLTSADESRLLRYSISGDSWTELPKQPNDGSTDPGNGSDDGGSSALIGSYIYRLKGGGGNGGTASTDFFRYLDLPTVTTYDPADGATGVATTTNLVLTFDETVVADTGNIVIYDSGDNVFESIPVGDARVTVDGATVTINPTSTFANSTGYYVQIAATCFDDEVDNSYAGIDDKITWNFTTLTSGGGGSGGGVSKGSKACFIATASYGTPMAEEVKILSAFRDEYLLTNKTGQALVKFYYRHSPRVADFIRDKEPLKTIVRSGLKPLVWLAKKANSQ